MPFDARSYLVVSLTGEQLVHISGETCDQQILIMPSVCRLLAYQAQAIESKAYLLVLADMYVVSRVCHGFIVAAVLPPTYILAEIQFELQLLAARVTLATTRSVLAVEPVQSGQFAQSTQLDSCHSRALLRQLNLQQLRGDRLSALQVLGVLQSSSGVLSIQLKQYDLCGDLSQAAVLESATDASLGDACSFVPPWTTPGTDIACHLLKAPCSAALSRHRAPDQHNSCMQLARNAEVRNPKVTFAAVFIEHSNVYLVAAIKYMKLPNNCMFIIAWFRLEQCPPVLANSRLSVRSHVLIGKAALPTEVYVKLTRCAHTLKRLLHVP